MSAKSAPSAARRTKKPPPTQPGRPPPTPIQERADYALTLLDVEEVEPYVTRQRMISKRFGVAMSTAADDIKRAQVMQAERYAALRPYYGGMVLQSLERIARKAEATDKLGVARATWVDIAKTCGLLLEQSDEAAARKMSDAALEAAIAAEAAVRLERMSEPEIADLLRRKQEEPTS